MSRYHSYIRQYNNMSLEELGQEFRERHEALLELRDPGSGGTDSEIADHVSRLEALRSLILAKRELRGWV